MDDPGAELLTFEDVLYVSNGLVPICEYRGRRFGVPFRLMEPGSTIRVPGDRGRIVMARAVASWMGLSLDEPPTAEPST